MSDPVVCVECGATSYNDPGKTLIRCASCWEKLKSENMRLQKEMDAIVSLDGLTVEKAQQIREENIRLREALGTAADTIAAVVRGCTYESEERAKTGVYGISHEAFVMIYEFIETYEDIRKHVTKGVNDG